MELSKFCQTKLISFFDCFTSLVDGGKAVYAIYSDFSKTFNKIPHDMLISKLVKHGLHYMIHALDGFTIIWITMKLPHQWLLTSMADNFEWGPAGLCLGLTNLQHLY